MKSGISIDNQLIVAEQQEKEKKFWLNQLSGELVKSFFPYDLDNWESRGEECTAALVPFEWAGALSSGLSAQGGGSPYKIHIIVLAGISLLLDKYTGNGDIIVITPVYRPDIQEDFINVVLPVRTQPGTQKTFRELLKLVSKTVVEASAHQNYPMNVLLEQIGMPLIQGEPSLFETALVIENIHDPGHIRHMNPGIIFSLLVTEDSIKGKVEYPANLYERTTIERLIEHLGRLLGEAVQNLDSPLSQLEIVLEQEKKQLLYEWNHQKGLSLLTLPETAHLSAQRLYVVDKYNHLQPPGIEGEVGIAGPALLGGMEDPFFPGQRVLKTGDIGQWQPDGTFEFSGREENRFLCRGCWVQPEKLERYLLKLAPLIEVVVTVLKNEYQGDTLRAYFVSERNLSPSEIKERLTGKLPGYLLPGSFARLDRIPLTPAGQKDRNPQILQESETRAKARFAVPADTTEERLRTIWSEVLEMESEDIPVDMDFAQFGGQSLKAIMMSSKIHKVFNISIPIPTIFQLSTIRGLGQYVKDTIKTEFCPIDPAEKRDYYELSPGQKRLYLLQQLDLESISYNVPQMVILEGDLRRERLEAAFTQIIRRHESLRTSFRLLEDQPVQKIHDLVEFAIEYYEAGSEANKQGEPDRGASQEFQGFEANFLKPFNLSQVPLLRVGLVKKNNSRHILMVDRHHIISDATSRGIFLKDIIRLYEGNELPLLRLQYKDYSQWQNSPKQKQEIKEQENYWLTEFNTGGEIPVLNLTLDYPRPMVQSFEGNDFGFSLGEEETQQIQQMATGQGATLFMGLLAIYNVFLSKICQQEDIIVGTPVVGRRHEDLKDILGIFVNTLALRNFPVSGKSFKEFLNDVKIRALSAFENQVYPFEELVDRVVINRDISRNPLFDTVFMLQELGSPDMEAGELKVLPYEYHSTTAKFDLLLSGGKENQILYFVFEYGTKLFKESTIQRYAGFFKKIIAEVLENSDKKISGIEIISEEEKERLLMDFNRTYTCYPREKTLHWLFEEQAESTPDHIALAGACELTESGEGMWGVPVYITYHELNRGSHRLAQVLLERGVKPDTIVGIMAERSVEMVFGVLGILKAGGAYLPIDPEYPGERIHYMLQDSNAKILISYRNNLGTGHCPVPILDLVHAVRGKFGIQKLGTGQNNSTGTGQCPVPTHSPTTGHWSPATSLAYIIYTSGTTGKPKGVMIQHSSVVNILSALFKMYPFTETDSCLLKTSFTFDVSVSELFGWFLGGGRLVILRKDDHKDPRKIVEAIEYSRITHINFVPSMFGVFIDQLAQEDDAKAKLSDLRYIFLAGEALPPQQVEKFRQLNLGSAVALENLYGPSESTIYVSGYSLSQWSGSENNSVPIGKPLQNTTLFIFDKSLVPTPPGVIGELFIGGHGVARGYLNRPELTAERFIIWSDWSDQSDRVNRSYIKLYKTGDLTRWLSAGDIEFLGRIDHQVKIRGFRVELGEIESRLLMHHEVKAAVVLGKADERGDKYLCAYIVLERKGGELEVEIKQYLSDFMPDYMIPLYFVQMDKIPLTPNGKVDRKALPEPDIKVGGNYIAPRDKMEKALVEIWSQILGVEKHIIGIDSNFFELGGHSLKATLLVNRLHKKLDVQVPLAQIFTSQTVRKLSLYIKGAVTEKFAAIEPVEKRDYYALSAAQKRLYLLQQMDLSGTAYNINEVVPLGEEWAVNKLELIFKKLIQRHDSLRTGFHLVEEEPVQLVHDEVEFEIENYEFEFEVKEEAVSSRQFLNATGKDTPLTQTRGPNTIIKAFIRSFDLFKPPLLRVGLIRHPTQNLLVMDIHHIISDGASLDLLKKEFQAQAAGEALSPLKLQYKDFSAWQNRRLESEAMNKLENYWLMNFQGEIPVLTLPYDYPRPLIQSFEGAALVFELREPQTRRLKAISQEADATVYMCLLSLYMIWLSKLSGQEDIIVGTPVAGRRHADLERIVGMFVNTLPIRRHPVGEKSFGEFLKEVKEHTLDAFENQEYQFEALVEKVAIRRDTGRNPIFDVMFGMLNPSPAAGSAHSRELGEIREIGEIETSPGHRPGTAKFDLNLTAVDRGEDQGKELFFNLQYCTRLFNPQTIELWVGYFKKIIDTVAECPQVKISRIDLLSPGEKHRVLVEFNRTAAPYPQDKTIPEFFAGQAERTPDRVALEGKKLQIPNYKLQTNSQLQITNNEPQIPMAGHAAGGDDIFISYRELNQKSNRLAGWLIEKGVKPAIITGIMVERSVEMIIGIFGILKAGAAYLPIDPSYPNERILYMLADSGTEMLVTTRAMDERVRAVGELPLQSILLEKVFSPLTLTSTSTCQFGHANLAYILYTSGSTGKPRGVMVEHCSVMNILSALFKMYPLTETDGYLLKTSYTFDVSVSELLGWFWGGGRLVILGKDDHKDPQKIVEAIEYSSVTHINFVPSLFGIFIDYLAHDAGEKVKLSSLKYIFLAGEALPPWQVEKFRQLDSSIALENLYGPTEGTIYVSGYSLSHWDGNGDFPISIGTPLQNTALYIFDRHLMAVPVGVSGELFIGGQGVARGYLNNPELTAEKFVISHWSLVIKKFKRAATGQSSLIIGSSSQLSTNDQCPMTNDRLYKTGDLARWLPDQNIEFLGRIDYQVKIRGFRVELGEIENRLLKHPAVKDSVVLDRTDATGDKYLCAYVVPREPGGFEELHITAKIAELKEYLSQRLPEYMVPSYFVVLDNLPLSPVGKVDRRTLPEPKLEVTGQYEAPRDEIEEKLVEMWSEVLGGGEGRLKIGIGDHFFGLGGHSLKAAVLTAKIRKEFKVMIPLADMFNRPYIKSLAEIIRDAAIHEDAGIVPAAGDHFELLKKGNPNAANLFFIHDGSGEVDGYIEFCSRLPDEFNCWGIRAIKIENYAPRNLTIQDVAQRYLEEIKAFQAHGPYHIVGWSIGGTIAFEILRRLEQRQEEVGFLALIDTLPPDKNRSEPGIEFNRETELQFIRSYLRDEEMKSIFENAGEIDLSGIWPRLLDYGEEKGIEFDIRVIKNSIPGNWGQIIPNVARLGIKELIYYLNMVRTYDHARNRYVPQGKVQTGVHFFKAGEAARSIGAEKWNLYCREPLRIYEIPGDHVSVLKVPQVESFAQLFLKVLRKALKSNP